MQLLSVDPLWAGALGVLALNIPFGYWRAGERRFSLPWFLAVHIPVPLVVGLRILLALGWRFTTFPVLVSAFFLGQFLGGALRRLQRQKVKAKQSIP